MWLGSCHISYLLLPRAPLGCSSPPAASRHLRHSKQGFNSNCPFPNSPKGIVSRSLAGDVLARAGSHRTTLITDTDVQLRDWRDLRPSGEGDPRSQKEHRLYYERLFTLPGAESESDDESWDPQVGGGDLADGDYGTHDNGAPEITHRLYPVEVRHWKNFDTDVATFYQGGPSATPDPHRYSRLPERSLSTSSKGAALEYSVHVLHPVARLLSLAGAEVVWHPDGRSITAQPNSFGGIAPGLTLLHYTRGASSEVNCTMAGQGQRRSHPPFQAAAVGNVVLEGRLDLARYQQDLAAVDLRDETAMQLLVDGKARLTGPQQQALTALTQLTSCAYAHGVRFCLLSAGRYTVFHHLTLARNEESGEEELVIHVTEPFASNDRAYSLSQRLLVFCLMALGDEQRGLSVDLSHYPLPQIQQTPLPAPGEPPVLDGAFTHSQLAIEGLIGHGSTADVLAGRAGGTLLAIKAAVETPQWPLEASRAAQRRELDVYRHLASCPEAEQAPVPRVVGSGMLHTPLRTLPVIITTRAPGEQLQHAPRTQAVRTAVQQAYQQLHQMGVAHSDSRAANILVHAPEKGEPIVTLIDLNLAEVGASPQQMEWEMEDVNRILDSLGFPQA